MPVSSSGGMSEIRKKRKQKMANAIMQHFFFASKYRSAHASFVQCQPVNRMLCPSPYCFEVCSSHILAPQPLKSVYNPQNDTVWSQYQ